MNELAIEIKKAIVKLMNDSKLGQNEVARKFGISTAHMSNLMNEKFDQISKAKLTELANSLGVSYEKKWQIVATEQLTIIHNVCKEAKANSRFGAIVAPTGQGKTTALVLFERTNTNSYYVLCNVLMTQSIFLKSIAKSMGISQVGSKIELLERITNKLKSAELPLLILDDLGKVNDKIYQMLQLIYDECKGACGIVIAGVPHMQKYIKQKKERESFCFPELYRRVSFWKNISPIKPATVEQIAMIHEIKDADVLKFLKKHVENYGNLEEWITNAKKNAKGDEVSLEIMIKSANINN